MNELSRLHLLSKIYKRLGRRDTASSAGFVTFVLKVGEREREIGKELNFEGATDHLHLES